MAWSFDAGRPIYLQLVEHIQQKILNGEYQPGEKLPSVRDLAAEAAVNPNTMQKALSELERGGLVFAQRTSGRFITDDAAKIRRLRQAAALAIARRFLADLNQLGITPNEAAALLDAAQTSYTRSDDSE
ncbi:MAG TPA: GntR family transcriptional regulator [Candidatus Avidehalobacter gallistercoris]|uniref:GntR family transcriptional regulator n=1 Tax=Candidatus Avidehalobacter gallistercoris TaxID=2840694 RepID=A0A9D1KY55_9FIRM|nr:GntR family transcriptional regulator [Candidatus Avidehalobacter gallistercoris]